MSNFLTDEYGRQMRKLRVSLLDACNFRCTYCMPANASFAKVHNLLGPEETASIVGHLVELGVEEVRLTGGEPTLRAELVEIVECLSKLPLKSLGLTTNGLLLKELAPKLKAAGLHGVNVSLDSLDVKRFRSMARVDGLQQVLAGIDASLEAGLKVKINTVLVKENLLELPALLKFAREKGIEIRFLELMKIGVALDYFEEAFVSAGEVIHRLRREFKLKQIPVPADSTAFKYELSDGTRVGFIASESLPFCGSCSRLRLDSKGHLRSCLMKEDSMNLRGLGLEQYPEVLKQVLKAKPYTRVEKVQQPMYQIGG